VSYGSYRRRRDTQARYRQRYAEEQARNQDLKDSGLSTGPKPTPGWALLLFMLALVGFAIWFGAMTGQL
jgi:hypothetical protein